MTARCTCSGSAAGVRLQVARLECRRTAPSQTPARAPAPAVSPSPRQPSAPPHLRTLATPCRAPRSAVLYYEQGNFMGDYFSIRRRLSWTNPESCTAGEKTSEPAAGTTLRENLVRPSFAKPRLTKPGRNPMTRFPLRRAACDRGGVAERLKAADCKSADVRLRRFESYPLHQRSVAAGIGGSAIGPAAASARSVGRSAGVAQW